MAFGKSARRAVLAAMAAVTLMLATLAPASAHVGVKADTSAAGSTAIVTFGFGHGCGESPTTALVIQVPEQFNSATPVFAPGWSIDVEMEELDEQISGSHGEEITERTATITFTADEPIENNIYAMVSIRLALPEDAAGETIYFPVIQECEDGETAWIEIPQEGEDGESLESPAPSITVTEPESGDDH